MQSCIITSMQGSAYSQQQISSLEIPSSNRREFPRRRFARGVSLPLALTEAESLVLLVFRCVNMLSTKAKSVLVVAALVVVAVCIAVSVVISKSGGGDSGGRAGTTTFSGSSLSIDHAL